MSREVRRVPLDFDFPQGQTWTGYLMPDELRLPGCPDCEATGYSPDARRLMNRWYGKAPFRPEDRGSEPLTVTTPGVRAFAERNVVHAPWFYGSGEAAIVREARRLSSMWNEQWCHHLNQADVDALVAAGRLMDFTHTWDREERRWVPKDPPYTPTAAEVNAWALNGMGHDSINQSIVVTAELERLGLPRLCSTCNGSGEVATPEQKAAEEAWEPTPPPEGPGWQLWQTVSEGGPCSPVFPTREGLVDWLCTEYRQVGSERPMTRRQAEAFVEVGFSAGSGALLSTAEGTVVLSGEAAIFGRDGEPAEP
jgi:hypothetical protein